MRPGIPPTLAPLVAFALLSAIAACAAPNPVIFATATPGLYTGPVEAHTPAPTVLVNALRTPVTRLTPQGFVPTPGAARPAGYVLDALLQRRLLEVLGQDADHYGVYVKNLKTGRGAAVNPDKVFNAASLFKIEVMWEVFRQRDAGALRFDELLVVNEYYAQFDLGTLPVEVGQSLSIAEALFYMMSISDNVSAVLLQDRVGSSNVNAAMAALGLKSSGLFPEGLPATAADFGLLLEAIARDESESNRQMVELLARERIDNGLLAGVPRNVPVAHKTGNWSDATNDAGIIFAPAGTYVLVVLSDLGYQSTKTRLLSEAVYALFEEPAR
jgi:beta-lactamase class A